MEHKRINQAIFLIVLFLGNLLQAQDPAIHVTEEGNVAIGDWVAAAKLHVSGGGIYTDQFFGFYGGTAEMNLDENFSYIGSPRFGNLEFYIGGKPKVTIDGGGLRIGRGDFGQVDYPLHVFGNSVGGPMIKIESESTGAAIEYKTNDVPDSISNYWFTGINGPYPGKYWLQGSGYGPSVFFDWKGYNGFNIAEPKAVLHIAQRVFGAKDGFRITSASSVLNIFGTPGGYFHIESNTALILNQGGHFVGIGSETIPSYPLQMASGAHVTVGGVWTDASSRSLKENIRDLTEEEAINALSQLNPQKYSYKAEKEEEYLGFIAEDVPDLVATKERKSISPMDIVALLTKVVQQQQKRIDQLELHLNSHDK